MFVSPSWVLLANGSFGTNPTHAVVRGWFSQLLSLSYRYETRPAHFEQGFFAASIATSEESAAQRT